MSIFIHTSEKYVPAKKVSFADDYQVFAPISSEKSDAKLFI